MQFSVTFRHMDATESLKEYARDRLLKIKKYLPDPIAVHVVLSTVRHTHRVDVNLQLHDGFTIAGSEATEDMYSALDLVSAKIESQVRRHKDKLRQHKGRPLQPVVIEMSGPADSVPAGADAPATDAGPAAVTPPPPVITTEKVQAESMPVSEAIVQMNALQGSFLVFRNTETGAVSVVYRRGDGSYGLIEPTPPS
jgi:putative sigma-54 modulation protein